MHWYRAFSTCVNRIEGIDDANRLNLLINYLDPAVYELISESESYDVAIDLLRSIFAERPSPIFSRYVLQCRKQQAGESLYAYLQNLKRSSADCDFRAASAIVHKEAIRDAFISGMMSNEMLTAAYDKARSLELAQKNCYYEYFL